MGLSLGRKLPRNMARTAELPRKIQDAMNEQLKEELSSAYQYLAMSAYLETVPLPGASAWMRAQAQEEVGHAMKFFHFVSDRGGRVALHAIPAPKADFGSPLQVFEDALAHEQKVTGMILRLYEFAMEAKDYASQPLLSEFLQEQIEEEKTASTIVEMMRMAGSQGPALLLVDRQLAQRGGGAPGGAPRERGG